MTDKSDEDTWKTPEYACLNCGYVVDMATASPLETESRAPQEGDVMICLECSHIMIAKADGTVRDATRDEQDEIASEPDILMLLRGLRSVRQSPEWRRRK